MSENLIPIFVTMFLFGGTVAVVALVLRYKARKLEHQEVMRSLEHGQELPTLEVKRKYNYLNDLRIGIILAAAGLGTWAFLRETRYGSDMAALGFIPMLIGIGFVVMGFILKNVTENGDKKGNG